LRKRLRKQRRRSVTRARSCRSRGPTEDRRGPASHQWPSGPPCGPCGDGCAGTAPSSCGSRSASARVSRNVPAHRAPPPWYAKGRSTC